MIKRTLGALFAVTVLFHGAPATAFPGDLVIMQGLDKVTARVSTFEAPLGTTVRFGTLEITVRNCDRTPPEEPPESAVYLHVVESRKDEQATELFTGWMFSSSPALSALEHPVYDVWVLECQRTADAPKSGTR